MSKIKIAFIKFGGLSAGGTERWLQTMAANLPKDKFNIDYFYCDSAPYLGSDYKHGDTDQNRKKYMEDHGINLIKFNVEYKDITTTTHDWINTNFWEKFDESKYDLIQSAKAGPPEYPFNHIKTVPIIDSIHLFGLDNNPNIAWTCFLSEWSRKKWLSIGGDYNKSSVIHSPIQIPITTKKLRVELNIPLDAIVAGYHQRVDNNIVSEIPLKAFSKIQNPKWHFIIMGGGSKYRELAKELNLKNIHFLNSSGDPTKISSFLNTLDIFAHGRKDGETFGTVLAEAMIHRLPCLSHYSGIADAQPETMGPGGFFVKDLNEYTKKLEEFFKNKELREKIGNLGKDYAEKNYTIKNNIEKLCNIYNKVLKNKKINKKFLEETKKELNKELKYTFKKRLTIFIKKIVYNKYLFICYRFLKNKWKK